MSRIYIVSPSSAVRDKAAARRGVARLKALGHEVQLDESAYASHMRFAGDDATRLAALDRAAASGADIVLTTRGGYGLTRLLPDIRYKAVAKAIDKGMRFVGLSDFTAFQNAVAARAGAVSWSGPALLEDFGVAETPDDIMSACFDDLASGAGEGTGWQLPRAEARAATAAQLRDSAGGDPTDAGRQALAGGGPLGATWEIGALCALQEALDGNHVTWMEHVTDEQYDAPVSP